ncbi:hypothetical protein JYU34_002130 [Plutella xylostella]|uniref:Uncharacterized protein n=1 Tax=Plutella xylostella TaxID=51655 RepID=A0ABQ7R1L8_PLUXY|nr:hypothetical protein JYU34_002130 [Plutella xylostella]
MAGGDDAGDARGRTTQPQWAPPLPPDNVPDESSSEEEMEVAAVDSPATRPHGKFVEGVNGIYEVKAKDGLIPDHALVSAHRPRKRRPGLVTERAISPRTEEDKLAGRLEVKRYKETKEKLRRRREKLLQKVRLLQQATRRKKDKEITVHDLKLSQMVDLVDSDSDSSDCDELVEQPEQPPGPGHQPGQPGQQPGEPVKREPTPEPVEDADEAARRIKEVFRSTMARVMVAHLNPYRHR